MLSGKEGYQKLKIKEDRSSLYRSETMRSLKESAIETGKAISKIPNGEGSLGTRIGHAVGEVMGLVEQGTGRYDLGIDGVLNEAWESTKDMSADETKAVMTSARKERRRQLASSGTVFSSRKQKQA